MGLRREQLAFHLRGRLMGSRAAIALVLTVFAATLALPAKPPATVEEIVARHVAARGGLEKIRSIQTLRQRGRAHAGASREALVMREIKRPGKTRFEFTVQGVTSVFASDGKTGWKVSPLEGEMGVVPLSDEVVSEASEQGDIEGPLVDWQAKGHRVELAGRERVGDRETYKLKVTLASGAVRHEYLDPSSFLIVRTDSTRQVRGRPVEIQTTYGAHKKTGGVAFPRRIEVTAAGRPNRLRVDIEEVEVNPPLPDSRFAMPEGAGARPGP
jgi:outer membrane lipoprotein-sorting protein